MFRKSNREFVLYLSVRGTLDLIIFDRMGRRSISYSPSTSILGTSCPKEKRLQSRNRSNSGFLLK